MRCACGRADYGEAARVKGVLVDAAGRGNPCQFEVASCRACGLTRQVAMPFSTQQEFADYYRRYPPVTQSYAAKDYAHDRAVAASRCDAYEITTGYRGRVLDVGCGSGAFVDECVARGADAYGCEIAPYANRGGEGRVYWSQLEDVNFPTDHFDVVTCHDVLEHVIDPLDFLHEMFRITKQRGLCLVEIPNFFSADGKHHWKKHEHLWFFSQDQLEALAAQAGFVTTDIENPIPSKMLFYFSKPPQQRSKILLPPGIGDSYWSIVKLESFIEKYHTGLPDIYVACNRDRKYDGNNRAFPFIEMFPFLNSSGVSISNSTHPNLRPIWREAYAHMGRTIFKDVFGCDYFLSYNGHLRFGKQLEEVDPDLACDWVPPMFVSLEQERYRKGALAKYGKYIVYYFVFQGTYKYWVDEFPIKKVVDAVNHITQVTGLQPVFTGAMWDKDDEMLTSVVRNVKGVVDLRGETSVEQLFGLIRGSEAMVGYPSGATIMGAVLGARTLIIWNDYYNRDFSWFCAPPGVRGSSYRTEVTKKLSSEKLSASVCDLVGIKKDILLKTPSRRSTVAHLKHKVPVVVATTLNGGYYTQSEVLALRDMVARGLSVKHEFVCLTDTDFKADGITTIPMTCGLAWPWSRLELFRNDLESSIFKDALVMFLDLNVMIVRNIDDLVMHEHDFSMLMAYNTNRKQGNWSADVMAWKGEYNRLLDRYLRCVGVSPVQNFVGLFIANHVGLKPNTIQVLQRGVYSYKLHCTKGLPSDASIVWFHGRPNYPEAGDAWITESLNAGLSPEEMANG